MQPIASKYCDTIEAPTLAAEILCLTEFFICHLSIELQFIAPLYVTTVMSVFIILDLWKYLKLLHVCVPGMQGSGSGEHGSGGSFVGWTATAAGGE